MAVKSIAFTMYPVADVARSVDFYRDVVGLEVGAVMPGMYAEFAVGDGYFSVGGPDIPSSPAGTAHSLALEVDSVKDEIARLAAAGVEAQPIFETQVCFISSFRDPDGNGVFLHEAKPATGAAS